MRIPASFMKLLVGILLLSLSLVTPVTGASFTEEFDNANFTTANVVAGTPLHATFDNPGYIFREFNFIGSHKVTHNGTFIEISVPPATSTIGSMFLDLQPYFNAPSASLSLVLAYEKITTDTITFTLIGHNTTSNSQFIYDIIYLGNGSVMENLLYAAPDVIPRNMTMTYVAGENQTILFDTIEIIQGNVTPYTPSLTYITLFNETFTTGPPFTINECQSVCGEQSCLQTFSPSYHFDNYWYCWKSFGSLNSWNGKSSTDTSRIDTPLGLEMYSSTLFSLMTDLRRKMVSIIPSPLPLTANTTISFTCSIPDQAKNIDAFFYLGKSGLFEQENNSVLISLGKGSSPSGCGLSPIQTTKCCDLSAIVGAQNECNATKKRISFSVEQLLNACPAISSPDLDYVTQIGLYAVEYDFVGWSYIWLDDILIREAQGAVVQPNGTLDLMPEIVSVLPSRNPVNVSEQMYWDVGWMNDNSPAHNSTYVAFSCGGNATLDYPYGNYDDYGVAPFTYRFNCSYNQEGDFTAVAYITDVTYLPLGINNTGSGNVEVSLQSAPVSVECDGFVPPPCQGNCWFYDDFYYNANLACNGWNGTLRTPDSGVFRWNNPLAGEEPNIRAANINKNPIQNYDIAKFKVSFDFRSENNLSNTFYIRGVDNRYSVYLNFRGGKVRVASYYPTGLPYLFYYNLSEWNNVVIEVDLAKELATYRFNNATQSFTIPFLDMSVTSANEFLFGCDEFNCDFSIDNFLIELVEPASNVSVPSPVSNYSYNPALFCAINWTAGAGQRRFVEDNCRDRGFSTEYPLLSLCIPRACVQDIGFAVYESATGNILKTIIVLILFILLAPLAIALLRRR